MIAWYFHNLRLYIALFLIERLLPVVGFSNNKTEVVGKRCFERWKIILVLKYILIELSIAF